MARWSRRWTARRRSAVRCETPDLAERADNNTYGGYWVSTPFNDSARAQDDVAPLNRASVRRGGVDARRALGLLQDATERCQPRRALRTEETRLTAQGWLNTEPFITPALYEPFYNSATRAVDEWTLFQCVVRGWTGLTAQEP